MTEFNFAKQAQDYYSKAPVIVLGSGASIAFGLPGMGELAEYIKDNVDVSAIPGSETGSWTEFCGLLDTETDLEVALHQVNFSDVATSLIIQSAWELINRRDEDVYRSSISDRTLFPLGTMLSHMFKTSLAELNIVTTNYDCLAEYACDQEELHHYSGFSHGYTQRLAEPNFINCSRKVNIWKVHGSLDWFYCPDNETVSIPKSQFKPDNYQPQIVTPGVQKYQKTQQEPFRSIIRNSDNAISAANSYLCFGFGFNDEHIQPKLLAKCKRDNASIVIITHTLTEQAKAIISDDNIRNYLAIERAQDDVHSRIYSSQAEAPFVVDGEYWSLNGFLQLII